MLDKKNQYHDMYNIFGKVHFKHFIFKFLSITEKVHLFDLEKD